MLGMQMREESHSAGRARRMCSTAACRSDWRLVGGGGGGGWLQQFVPYVLLDGLLIQGSGNERNASGSKLRDGGHTVAPMAH